MKKYNIKYNTKFGKFIRTIVGVIGLKFLRVGQSFLKWSLYRCSLCGSDCGFDSTISSKGLRCQNLSRDCTRHP